MGIWKWIAGLRRPAKPQVLDPMAAYCDCVVELIEAAHEMTALLRNLKVLTANEPESGMGKDERIAFWEREHAKFQSSAQVLGMVVKQIDRDILQPIIRTIAVEERFAHNAMHRCKDAKTALENVAPAPVSQSSA